jgi:hypothetical protein
MFILTISRITNAEETSFIVVLSIYPTTYGQKTKLKCIHWE